jgi:hypothetical protein
VLSGLVVDTDLGNFLMFLLSFSAFLILPARHCWLAVRCLDGRAPRLLVLAEPERSSSFPINWERNDPGNVGNETNPGKDQAHVVHVKMPEMMRHEIIACNTIE